MTGRPLYSYATGSTDVAWIVMWDKTNGDLHLKGTIRQTQDQCVLVDVQADG